MTLRARGRITLRFGHSLRQGRLSNRHTILCIEDDLRIGALVRDQLRDLGYAVDWLVDGAAGLERYRESGYDLIVLDLMLPSLDGLSVCRKVRETDARTPILMLTAKASLHDVVAGLELGADEYVTKPFSIAELVARIRVLFRRLEMSRDPEDAAGDDQPLYRGALALDAFNHRVTLRGQPLALTAKEFALLLLFARQPGHCFSRGELLDAVWGAEFDGFDHTVNTHINRLRNKIEDDPAEPRYIRTVWGVGYRFAELAELEA